MSQPSHASAPRTLVVLPLDSAEYLGRIGISADSIRTAVERGEVRAVEHVSPAYPKTAAGLARWIETVGTVRRELMAADWKAEDPLMRPVVVNRERTVFLGVLGGTEATGDPASEEGPKAQRRKGVATEQALIGQMVMIPLSDVIGVPVGPSLSDPPPQGNWMVVYHRGDRGVQVEVSYPRDVKDGQITDWVVRVILEPFVPENLDVSPQDVGGGDVGFDVTPAS